jgi:hypothetical protein
MSFNKTVQFFIVWSTSFINLSFIRQIKEEMAGIVEESKVRRKELAAVREKKGEQEREDMPKSSEVRKESS